MSDEAEPPYVMIAATLPFRVALERAAHRRVLEVLLDNDFAPMREMVLETAWVPVDRARLFAQLDAPEVDISMRATSNDDATSAGLRTYDTYTSVRFFILGSEFPPDGCERARRLLGRLLDAMAPNAYGSIGVPTIADPFDRRAQVFHKKMDLIPLSDPFGDVVWLYAVSEESYRAHFTREVLLKTPAEVSEHAGRIWIQFYETPLAYDTPDARARIKRARDYLAANERDDFDEDEHDELGENEYSDLPKESATDVWFRMSGPLPATGDVLGGLVVGEEVAGAMFNNIHRGVYGKPPRDMLLTAAAGAPRTSIDDLRDILKYKQSGIAELMSIECFDGSGGPVSKLTEMRPPGRSLAELAPMRPADAVKCLLELVAIVEAAHKRAVTLVGIHPALCFVDDVGTVTGIAPRALPFLLAMPPMRGGLCLADAYAPAEVWRGEGRDIDSDVFSVCAVGLFIATGQPPFPAHGDPNRALAAVLRGLPPATPKTTLTTILARGLHPDPDKRIELDELRAVLTQHANTLG